MIEEIQLLSNNRQDEKYGEFTFAWNISRSCKISLAANNIRKLEWLMKDKSFDHVDLTQNSVTELKIISPQATARTVFKFSVRDFSSFKFEHQNVKLGDNYTLWLLTYPLICDWSLYKYLFKRTEGITYEFDSAKCHGPDNMDGRALSDLHETDLMNSSFTCFAICKCVNIDGNFLVNCSSLLLKNHPALTYENVVRELSEDVKSIRIDFMNNSFTKLPSIPFPFKVTEIIARHNLIEVLIAENLNDRVEFLDLSDNKLSSISAEVFKKLIFIKNISLGGNPWICNCSQLEFVNSMKSLQSNIVDYANVFCNNIPLADLDAFDLCFEVIYVIAACGTIFGVLGVIIGLFYKYQKDIKIFCYAHDIFLWFVTEEELDEEKVYDAFVCFASPDQPIVEDIIVKLESEHSFKCLVGIRDWPPGHMFAELVSRILFNSIKTLIQLNRLIPFRFRTQLINHAEPSFFCRQIFLSHIGADMSSELPKLKRSTSEGNE